MPGFYTMGTQLLTPWYEGRHRHRSVPLRLVFRRHPPKVARRNRREGVRAWASTFSVSTKDVHGLWITMWMSDQYDAVPQHLTHCPVGRQHNPCNFTGMQFHNRNSDGEKVQILHNQKDFLRLNVQKCADRWDRATLAGYHQWPIVQRGRC